MLILHTNYSEKCGITLSKLSLKRYKTFCELWQQPFTTTFYTGTEREDMTQHKKISHTSVCFKQRHMEDPNQTTLHLRRTVSSDQTTEVYRQIRMLGKWLHGSTVATKKPCTHARNKYAHGTLRNGAQHSTALCKFGKKAVGWDSFKLKYLELISIRGWSGTSISWKFHLCLHPSILLPCSAQGTLKLHRSA